MEENKQQCAATGAVFTDWAESMHKSSSDCVSLNGADLHIQEHVCEPQEWSEMSQEKSVDGIKVQEQSRFKDLPREKLPAGELIQEKQEPVEQLTGKESMELCWYCMKSHSLAELNTPQTDLKNKVLMPPYGGDPLSYQQDPRPHFGVAHSSRSTSFPLWGSEGHRALKQEPGEDERNSISNCPYCHLGLPLDTLRWHSEKCLLFEGSGNDI
ncbi:uncharacterized protein LOC124393926 [Silurus meridionalis]|uniref:uncharacterized protein LOC124393926 n=1 Tax=Silurus meridionalis TaxID=175797 RepID=UPI001EEA5DBF|nr:uncharacterized protein LOC124393926 [Silurus meridionalis]